MLLPLFQALEDSAIGEAIRNSLWMFPIIEAFHLVGLAVIGGAILVVDFRLLGLGLRTHSVSKLARDMQPWVIGSIVVMVLSGLPLFLSEAIKCYYSFAFWTKMTALLLAARVHLYRPALRHVCARRSIFTAAGEGSRHDVDCALGDGGLGRTLDRILRVDHRHASSDIESA